MKYLVNMKVENDIKCLELPIPLISKSLVIVMTMKKQDKDVGSSCEIKELPQVMIQPGGGNFLKQRNERIDSVKFWLIILVIAGHVFMRKEFCDSASCVVLYKWIYLFHMPLFVFISGYFSRKKDWRAFFASLWKLMEPLLFFQAIALLFYVQPFSVESVFTPWYALWYLLSLILWRMMLQIIPDNILNNSIIIIIIVTVCISILAGFLPWGKLLSIQRTLSFLPFFLLGYYMRGKNLFLPDKYKPLCIVYLILMFTLPLFLSQYLGNLSYASPYGSAFGAVNRIFLFCLAIPMSIAFINVCNNKPRIAQQGRLTMQYYIYHALIIPPLISIVDKQNIPMSFVTAGVITIGITLGIGLVLNFSIFKKFTNPSSLIIK